MKNLPKKFNISLRLFSIPFPIFFRKKCEVTEKSSPPPQNSKQVSYKQLLGNQAVYEIEVD